MRDIITAAMAVAFKQTKHQQEAEDLASSCILYHLQKGTLTKDNVCHTVWCRSHDYFRRNSRVPMTSLDAHIDEEGRPLSEVIGHEDPKPQSDILDRAIVALRTKTGRRGRPSEQFARMATQVWAGMLTYEQAATTYGLPLGTVRSKLSRAAAKLRKEFKED